MICPLIENVKQPQIATNNAFLMRHQLLKERCSEFSHPDSIPTIVESVLWGQGSFGSRGDTFKKISAMINEGSKKNINTSLQE